MPMTVNGIGTSICAGRGHVSWGGESDRDSMECLVFLYLPLIPYKALHTYNWNGFQYQAIPIRWSTSLVAHAFLRRWLWGPLWAGIILGIIAFTNSERQDPNWGLLAGGLGLVALSITVWSILAKSDVRTRDIRRVLGPHQFGSSDPATWTDDLLAAIYDPRELHGTATYAEAVPKLLRAGKYVDAMWAARFAAAREDWHEGEMLTDSILEDPDVRTALEQVRKDPKSWASVMLKVAVP